MYRFVSAIDTLNFTTAKDFYKSHHFHYNEFDCIMGFIQAFGILGNSFLCIRFANYVSLYKKVDS